MPTFCHIIILIALILNPMVCRSQEATLRITSSTFLSVNELPSTACKALFKIGLDNKIPIGIIVGTNKSICTASLTHLPIEEKISVANLIAVFDRDVSGYAMSLQDGVLNVSPINPGPHDQPILDVRIPEFRSPPASMARMGLRLWFSLQAVIAPEKGSAFAGGMSPAAETIPAIEIRGQGIVPILNTIIAGGHGGVWVIRDTSLTPDTRMSFEVRSYIGEDELIRQMSLC